MTGANLWDIKNGCWHEALLALAGGSNGAADLRSKLGPVPEDGGASFGTISSYFSNRYGFPSTTQIVAFTGDNPSTILALPLRSSDAIVSLGTSTTFLMSTDTYNPHPAYHFMNHPTTPGLYMFMLCYKNGGLARERIRDAINGNTADKSWEKFNELATSTPVLGQEKESDPMRLGLYFPRPEIVPAVKSGTWRHTFLPSTSQLTNAEDDPTLWPSPQADARAILESQFLSLRLRSTSLVSPQKSPQGETLPAQPRRIYLVGGGAANPAIASLAGQVLGGSEGIFKLEIGGNACALGSAYKAAWGVQRRSAEERFEDFLEGRWDESSFVRRVADGYQRGVFERYGDALDGFRELEGVAIQERGEERDVGGKDAKVDAGVVRAN